VHIHGYPDITAKIKNVSFVILWKLIFLNTNSWIIFLGADYCGRRFSSSEDLLIHLKTHTNLSTPSDPRTLASALLGVSTSGTASTASTLSTSSRFHPYARPLGSSVPPSLASALNPSLGLPPGYPHPYASLYPSLFPRPPLLWSRSKWKKYQKAKQ